MRFDSKLPDVGTTIFTVMSRRAIEEGAINTGQGFPDYPVDPRLAQALVEAVAEGHNQYAPMEGVIPLREEIAAKLQTSYGIGVDPLSEITVTCGATEALYDAIQAVIGPGDEALIFDPAYDAYEPAVRLAGGRCIRVPLEPPRFEFDWDRVRRSLSPRTRLIIINSPQNPSCTVAGRADLEALAALVRDRPISILADEVYENVGVRWAPARLGARTPGAARAQLRRVLLRQGAARDRLAHGLLRCPALAHPRAAQSASIQHVQHRGAAPTCDCPVYRPLSRRVGRTIGLFSAQARPSRGSIEGFGFRSACARQERTFCWWTIARSAARATWNSRIA